LWTEESAANQNLGENNFSRTASQRFHDWSVLGQHTWLLSANSVNEARVQFSRHPIRFANNPASGGNGAAVNIPASLTSARLRSQSSTASRTG